MSLERITSSNDITLLERALPVELASFRSLGLLVLDHSADERMTWQYGLFSESRPIEGDSIGEGQWAATARFSGLPVYEDEGEELLHLGASASWRKTSDDPVTFTQRPETHGWRSTTGFGVNRRIR